MAVFDDCVAYYRLDESSGTTAYDAVGAHNGTTTGATVNQAGLIGTSYSFDGSGDYVDLGFNNPTNAAFTWNIWIKRNGNPAGVEQPICIDNGTTAVGAALLTDGKIIVYSGSNLGTTTNTFTSNNWTMFTLVYDGTRGYIYRNGTEEVDAAWTPSNATTNLFIGVRGTDPSHNYFTGLLDEVGIWDRALSSTEVTALYNSGAGITFSVNVTVTPSALSLSTTEAEPVYLIQVPSLSLSSSLSLPTSSLSIVSFSMTVLNGTGTKGTRYVNKNYESNDYRIMNLVPELGSDVPMKERVLI